MTEQIDTKSETTRLSPLGVVGSLAMMGMVLSIPFVMLGTDLFGTGPKARKAQMDDLLLTTVEGPQGARQCGADLWLVEEGTTTYRACKLKAERDGTITQFAAQREKRRYCMTGENSDGQECFGRFGIIGK